MTHGTLVGVAHDGAHYCLDCAPAVVGTTSPEEAVATAEAQGTGGALLAGFEYDAPVALRNPRTFFSDPDDLTDFVGDGLTHLGIVSPPVCATCGGVIDGGQPLPVHEGAYPPYRVQRELGASLLIAW